MQFGVAVRRDLVYASADGRPLKLDLYLPEVREETPPVALYLHGGAFMVGAKENDAEERLVPVARSGITVASAQYRFSDVAQYPAQVHDVKAAVRWLRAHADEYGYRGERVGAWGASAGAYLALMLGLTVGSAEHEGALGEHLDRSSSVEAVCAWFAPADILSVDTEPAPPGRTLPPFISGPLPQPSIMARLLGVDSVPGNPDLAAAASPINHTAGATGSFLLMHGDRDGLIGEEQSRRMHEALLGAGVDSTLLLVAGANHEDPAFHSPAALGAVSGFLAASL